MFISLMITPFFFAATITPYYGEYGHPLRMPFSRY